TATHTLSLHDALPISHSNGGRTKLQWGTTYLSFYSAPYVPQSHADKLAPPMSEFIGKLLMHLPHALRVILCIAFYFSLLAIFLRSEEHTSELQSRFDL